LVANGGGAGAGGRGAAVVVAGGRGRADVATADGVADLVGAGVVVAAGVVATALVPAGDGSAARAGGRADVPQPPATRASAVRTGASRTRRP
jgi:hypothetical protein